jgi:hypothetical protein
MHKLYVCALAWTLALTAQNATRNYKDRAEYDLYDSASKNFAAGNFTKALADLDQWTEKYPASEFRNNRQSLYVQAYYGARQLAKAVEAGGELILDDPAKSFDTPAERLRILYTVCVAIQYLPDPNDAQTRIGADASRQLQAFEKAPPGMSDADWTKARLDLLKAAQGASLHLALVPVVRLLKSGDCARADHAAAQAQEVFPDSAQAAWYRGSAVMCLAKSAPEKVPFALYQFARAAALDPAKGMVDPKWQQVTVTPYLDKIFAQYHGEDTGALNQLKLLATQSVNPPNGFTIKSRTELLAEKEAEFESKNPEVAMWMKIKAALLAPNGEDYFTTGLKDSELPKLTGVIVSVKPACRPTHLGLAVRTPENPNPQQPEVILKLEKPLSGKPDPEATEIKWSGVAKSFAKDPFLLTVETDASKLERLKLTPCTAADGPRKK